jgi:putative SOS response-associated peptidase YedK
MCGRFVAATDEEGVTRFFLVDARVGEQVAPSWNVAPTHPVRAVVKDDDRRLLVTLRWGLVPRWADDPRIAGRLINARAETVLDKPAFREAVIRRRCIIPADGFYEWQAGAGGTKVPYFVHGDAPLAFAGIWESWRDPSGPDTSWLRTCTIITRPAQDSLRFLHDRMPVLLQPGTWAAWLDPDVRDRDEIRHMIEGGPMLLSAHRVSPAVNHVDNNHAALLHEVTDASTGQLDLLTDL